MCEKTKIIYLSGKNDDISTDNVIIIGRPVVTYNNRLSGYFSSELNEDVIGKEIYINGEKYSIRHEDNYKKSNIYQFTSISSNYRKEALPSWIEK